MLRKAEAIGPDERTYQCHNCGLRIDRNLNSALNIQNEGTVPTGHREFTPVDTKAATKMMDYNSIPNISASLVEEAGNPRLKVVR